MRVCFPQGDDAGGTVFIAFLHISEYNSQEWKGEAYGAQIDRDT